ncbi:MAG: peptidase [Pseudomonadota bacterium]|nr:peptidase [Pseudomonadota bacterium]
MKAIHALLMLTAIATLPAASSEYPDPEQVRQWVERGEILPLEDILARHQLPGDLLDAEVEWENEVLVYELKWLDSDHQRHKTWIDAHTGEWLGDNSKGYHP